MVSSFLCYLPLWVYIWLWNSCILLWVFMSKLTDTSCMWRGLWWPRSVCAQGILLRAELMSLKLIFLQLWLIFDYWIFSIGDTIFIIFSLLFVTGLGTESAECYVLPFTEHCHLNIGVFYCFYVLHLGNKYLPNIYYVPRSL